MALLSATLHVSVAPNCIPEFGISYVVTTYNKLPYLQQVLGRLVAARRPDEEIVVADGGSSDGTPAYLQGLYETGQTQ